MFVKTGNPHYRPHFHACYQGRVAIFAGTADRSFPEIYSAQGRTEFLE